MNPQLFDLYHRHAVASFDKQLYLGGVVAGEDWRFEMTSGQLAFGERFRWQVQLLGTESESSQGSEIGADLLRAAKFVQSMGDLLAIPDLVEPQVPLYEVDGHYLATLASGVCQAAAYYRVPYPGSALFLLIVDEHYQRQIDQPLARILAVFPQALLHLPIFNHKTAWNGYLRFYGLQSSDTGHSVQVDKDGQPVLTAKFDDKDRLVQLEGIIEPNLPIPPGS